MRTLISARLAPLLLLATSAAAPADEPAAIDIGSRRELLVDRFLIESLQGQARQILHHPTPRGVALVTDRPWEGNNLNYVTVLKEGDLYKMYYRGAETDRGVTARHEVVYCYAESRDGVHWMRPNLGLFEFDGSKQNNIILRQQDPELGVACHNFSPFLDTNPAAPASERYKAVGGLGPLYAFVSTDGIRWRRAQPGPIITVGAFDSQNVAFWDALRGEYRAYHRQYRRGGRDVMTETAASFLDGWTQPVLLEYPPSYDGAFRGDPRGPLGEPVTPGRGGELYTNQITPYHRAPHLFLGFPTRYENRGLTPSTKHLPQWKYRQFRSTVYGPGQSQREGVAVTEGLFMASRDGRNFRVYYEAFVRPGLRTRDSWFYGDHYQNNGLVETKSTIAPDAPGELSMYVTEATQQNGKPAVLRRYTLRLDGFVSISAPMRGGRCVTKPIRFSGNRLTLNYSSSARGGVRVGFVNATSGEAIAGFSLDDCPWIYGDALARPVEWSRSEKKQPAGYYTDTTVTADVSSLARKPVRLVFELKDADLYAFKFEDAPRGAGKESPFVANLRAGKSQTLVTYGTSLTAGGAWVGQLKTALDKAYPDRATVINSGAGAMWSTWGVENLDQRVIAKKPDMVLIEFAINDAYLDYKTSVARARKNLENMIDRILHSKASCEIVLMVMNPPIKVHLQRRPKIKDYYQMYREVAQARKLRLLDHYPAWQKILESDPKRFDAYVPDGIHPAPSGCQAVITPAIVRALGIDAK